MTKTTLSILIAAVLASTSARSAEQLERVTAEGSGRSSVQPYAPLNAMLDGLQKYGEGMFRLDFRMQPADEKKGYAITPPTLALMHADFYRPLTIGADGTVELPVLPEAEAKDADIVTNEPKGSLRLNGTLALNLRPEQVDLATVRRLDRLGDRLRSELLPWYARVFFPRFGGVRICSAQPGWELQWRDAQGQLLGLPLPQAKDERDPLLKPGEPARACAVLSGRENWPDAARLVAPAGTTLSVAVR
ncbi:hypothetical protein [Pelomonas sp. KK5]|uniref:hypothetical protein n=1 Tax=Pelomonas sp. KK5 TaxID=1855730 RepID=UPI00097BBE1B|nr:hypothetical protein [Pelomonas sp. KK5]